MDAAIIAGSAAVLVSLITAIAGLLNARNDRQQALTEAELLERLERVRPDSDEVNLLRRVLTKRLAMWDKKSQGDLEARAWRVMWPLVSVTFFLILVVVLLRPEFLFKGTTVFDSLGTFATILLFISGSSAAIAVLIYLVTTVWRRLKS